jgi:DNA-binding transcriptional regulator YiaG
MAKTLKEVMARLPKTRRAAVEKRTAALIAEELSLRELRKALAMTQTEVAESLGKGQDEVSRIEQRGDLLLSTLQAYVRSLGGELELVCRFKDRTPVRIRSQVTSSSPVRKTLRRRAAARAVG